MMENDVLKAIRERSSVRDYKDDPIPADLLDALKKAALHAPTSLDRQEQRFYFIQNKAVLKDIEKDVMKMAAERMHVPLCLRKNEYFCP